MTVLLSLLRIRNAKLCAKCLQSLQSVLLVVLMSIPDKRKFSCKFMSMLWSLWFLLLFLFCFFFRDAIKLLFLFCFLAFDLYRIDELKPTLSCPTKTIKSFTKFLVLIINPLLVILKEISVDRFLTIGFPVRLEVRRVNWMSLVSRGLNRAFLGEW